MSNVTICGSDYWKQKSHSQKKNKEIGNTMTYLLLKALDIFAQDNGQVYPIESSVFQC